jgi:non-ribosomal peptide synthetase component F
VKQNTLDAYSHQNVPFEKLVAELHPTRDLSRQPIFQTSMSVDNRSDTAFELAGLKTERLRANRIVAKFDLTLSLLETPSGLRGGFEYASDLFDHATIERLAGHFETLLQAIVADPSRKLSELALLSQDERHKLVVEWNDTAADYPRDKCIHTLFEEQVGKTPDCLAVCDEDTQLTYRELDERSNQLAHYLREQGVGPETIVAICVERSVEMVVGLLGVLKAGGAYLPMDPEYPADRLSFMLEDAQAKILLTQSKLQDRFAGSDARRIYLDADCKDIGKQPVSALANAANPDNLAYVIYTS